MKEGARAFLEMAATAAAHVARGACPLCGAASSAGANRGKSGGSKGVVLDVPAGAYRIR